MQNQHHCNGFQSSVGKCIFLSSSVWRLKRECLAGRRGRIESRQRKIQFTAKTRLLAPFTPPYKTVFSSSSSHSATLPTCLESFLPFLKFYLHSFSSSSPPSPVSNPFLLLLRPPPPFTSGQFFNLFEQSVDIQIKPLWQLGAV